MVSAGSTTIGLMSTGRANGVVNSHEIITGEFTRNTEFRIPGADLTLALENRMKDGLTMLDATKLSEAVKGEVQRASRHPDRSCQAP